MIRTRGASMLNIPFSAAEFTPYAAKYGFEAISVPGNLTGNPAHEIKALYMYFDYSSDSMPGTSFRLDEIGPAEDYTVLTE